MSTKILLSKKNTPWGIIINPVAQNIYRNVISFPNSNLRTEFINNELFNGENYKELIEATDKIGITWIDDITAKVQIDKTKYHDNDYELLNKDFLILLQEQNGIKKYYFYACKGTNISTNLIEYDLELDVFFTFDINFKNKQKILRGHIDRFKDFKFDFGQDSMFLNSDEIDEKIRNRIVKKNYKITFPVNVKTGEDIEKIKEVYNQTSWTIFYFSTHDEGNQNPANGDFSTKDFGMLINNKNNNNSSQIDFVNKIPITTIIVPNANWKVRDHNNIETWFRADKLYEQWKDKLTLLGVSSIDFTPLAKNNEITWEFDGTSTTRLLADVNIPLPINNSNSSDGLIFKTITIDTVDYTIMVRERNIKLDKLKTNILYTESEHIDLELQPTQTEISFLNPLTIRDKKFEPKLLMFPFSSIGILNIDTTRYEHFIPLMNLDNVKLVKDFSPTPEQNVFLTYINSGEYENFNKNIVNGYNHFVSVNYNLPVQNDAWEAYVYSHRVSSISGQDAGWKKVGSKSGDAIKGFGPQGLISGGLSAISGLFSIGSYPDIKQTPDSSSSPANDLIFNISIGSISDIIVFEQIPENNVQVVADYFYEFGYNILRIVDLNFYKKSRYYFNYLQASDTFSNLDTKQEVNGSYQSIELSAQIKQLIDTTIENGITFYHYRDITTWKGIKNFEFENVEMSLLSLPKKLKKSKNGNKKTRNK